MNELAAMRKRIGELGDDAGDAAFGIVEGLADVWVQDAQRTVPVDTGQLRARTNVVSIRASGRSAEATLQADTPYAGFVEYGTRYVPPRAFFRGGRDKAAQVAGGLGGRLESQLRRALTSGGSWSPRSLF